MQKSKGAKLCVCRMCPTYFDCGETLAFCLGDSGKSSCMLVERGCVCPGCPVQTETGFQHVYYCLRGGESMISEHDGSR